jgi:hypothetical protein
MAGSGMGFFEQELRLKLNMAPTDTAKNNFLMFL